MKEQAAIHYLLQCNCCHLYHLVTIILCYLFKEPAEMKVLCPENILSSQGQAVLKIFWLAGHGPVEAHQHPVSSAPI